MTRVNIEIPDELHKKIKVSCAMKQTTIKEYIKDVLEKRLRDKRKS